MNMKKGLYTPEEYIVEKFRNNVNEDRKINKEWYVDEIKKLEDLQKNGTVLTDAQKKKLKELKEEFRKRRIPLLKKEENELKKLIEKYKDKLKKNK